MKEGDWPSIVITGPTASGKGALGFELAARLGGEIISLDSMKVYREMEVGTAKPPASRRERVPYHLLDLKEPHESFSVGEYLPLLEEKLSEVAARKRPAILVGGTALYLKAFVDGFQAGPVANWQLRERLFDEAAQNGLEELHARLRAADPKAATKIHPKDARRIVRALEVLEATGTPISEAWAWGAEAHRAGALRIFGVEWPREDLYARIDRRVERMVEGGLFEEALRLQQRTPPLSRCAAQSIGLKEIWRGVAEGRPRADIVAKVQQETRRFAKRQMTWFRKLPIEWLSPPAQDQDAAAPALADEVLRKLLVREPSGGPPAA
jgi:tRNA dimethylallyltransferase